MMFGFAPVHSGITVGWACGVVRAGPARAVGNHGFGFSGHASAAGNGGQVAPRRGIDDLGCGLRDDDFVWHDQRLDTAANHSCHCGLISLPELISMKTASTKTLRGQPVLGKYYICVGAHRTMPSPIQPCAMVCWYEVSSLVMRWLESIPFPNPLL